jgi:hypothetical protein
LGQFWVNSEVRNPVLEVPASVLEVPSLGFESILTLTGVDFRVRNPDSGFSSHGFGPTGRSLRLTGRSLASSKADSGSCRPDFELRNRGFWSICHYSGTILVIRRPDFGQLQLIPAILRRFQLSVTVIWSDFVSQELILGGFLLCRTSVFVIDDRFWQSLLSNRLDLLLQRSDFVF